MIKPSTIIFTVMLAAMAMAAGPGDGATAVFAGSLTFRETMTLLSRPPDDCLAFPESGAFNDAFDQVAYVVAGDQGMRVMTNNSPGLLFDHIAKGYPIFSPITHKVGYIADGSGQTNVVIGDRIISGMDSACCLRFSPNGFFFAFIAQKGDRQYVTLNGYRLREYDMIDQAAGVLFSPDSNHAAYVAVKNGRQIVVHDGRESPPWDSIPEIQYGPDSRQLAYIAVRDKDYYVMQGDSPSGPFDFAQALTWSPDGKRLATIAIKGSQWLVVVNGIKIVTGEYVINTFFDKETNQYYSAAPQITPPDFSPDSEILTYVKTDGIKYRVVAGKKTGPAFDQVSRVVFSPDSRRFAYVGIKTIENESRQVVVLDGTPGKPFDLVGNPEFSPDSARLAYSARKDGQWRVVTDTDQGPFYDHVTAPYFSPDSAHMAYRALKNGKWRMVRNGVETEYDSISRFMFRPGAGGRNALVAMENDQWLVVTDGRKGKPYYSVSPPVFSPGGAHIVYMAQLTKGLTQRKIVVNETEGEELFNWLEDIPLVFDSENHLHTLVGKIENERVSIYRLDIQIDGQIEQTVRRPNANSGKNK